MNFSELCQEVYSLTNRPDLVAETQSAVRAATLRAHHLDFFVKDLYENSFQFDTSDFYQTFPTNLIPQFRAISYVRKYYPGVTNDTQYQAELVPPLSAIGYYPGNNLPDGRFLDIVSPTNVLDSYHMNRVDVAYMAGQNINIRSGDKLQYILFGAYIHPNITQAAYQSWIATENPYCIIFDAASVIFKTIGYDAQFQAYNALVQQEQNQVIQSNIQAVGY